MRGGYVRLSATSVLACKKMFFQESCNIAKDLSFCRFSLGGGSYAFGEQKKKKMVRNNQTEGILYVSFSRCLCLCSEGTSLIAQGAFWEHPRPAARGRLRPRALWSAENCLYEIDILPWPATGISFVSMRKVAASKKTACSGGRI